MRPRTTGLILTAVIAFTQAAWAQQNRIAGPIDNSRRITLRGHVHPQARPEFDQGRVSPGLTLPYMTLALAPSAVQSADLQQLLADQQNPGSPDFHRWLTPEQFADRFGASAQDVARIEEWLSSQGLQVLSAARGRTWIAFSGTAAQVETAFQTEIHQYVVNGETHFANSVDPSLPAAFQNAIQGVRGLHDFRLRPGKRTLTNPAYTSSHGNHYLAPDDFAAIYNVTPLYKAGITGTGQKLVVAGQTQINMSDIDTFRMEYGLPANEPQLTLVPGSTDPGISKTDLPEADLDIEWAGAVARNATILFVYDLDVMNAVQYAIDQNLAPVVSTSYGLCEAEDSKFDLQAMRSWAQQGNAQGITWVASSGDNGGADCNDTTNTGLAVDAPASIPEVTGIGGTEFNEGAGQYWNATNGSTKASVLSYIPETTWNDSVADGSPAAGGGGASAYFAKPSWQTGPGVPSDNARHVPDLALSASADHDGYLVYSSGSDQVYGGTSVPTPSFAGIAALLNQSLVQNGAAAGLGNINPKLYALAQSNPAVFHDITTGDNIVTASCSARRGRTCSSTPVGFSAGAGYDQATGLGSVDAAALVAAWTGSMPTIGPVAPQSHFNLSLLTSLTTPSASDVVFMIATVTSADGVTPSGVVTFQAGSTILGSALLTGSAGTATATVAVKATQLPSGSQTITASYAQAPSASVTLSVQGTGLGAVPSIGGIVNGASMLPAFAPGGIVTVFGSQLAVSTSLASTVPLPVLMSGVAATINGVAAPLYYVSPTQLNLQIPYEIPAAPATLEINNNGKVTSQTIRITTAGPGIFTNASGAPVPGVKGAAGQIVTLYVTGTGAVSPAVATGAAPAQDSAIASLPAPVTNPFTVTVGGKPAALTFVGIPPGEVGAAQVNYQIPAGLALGPQPVVVTIGGVASAPATITITN